MTIISLPQVSVLSMLLCSTFGKFLPDLYWNSSNPIFSNGVNFLNVHIMDSLAIHCPHYSDTTLLDQTEQSIIYRVSKDSYEKCRLEESSEPVAQCSDPFTDIDIRLVFRRFTPLPSGLEYHPGNTYFFISTSGGKASQLRWQKGGLCAERNLRLRLDVQPQKRLQSLNEGPSNRLHGNNRFSPKFGATKQQMEASVASGKNSVTEQLSNDNMSPYWDEFLQKVMQGREGPSWWGATEKKKDIRNRKTALTLDNDEMRGSGQSFSYSTNDNSQLADASRQIQLNAISGPNADRHKLYEIHEFNDFNLPYRSSGAMGRLTMKWIIVICFLLLMQFSLVLLVRN